MLAKPTFDYVKAQIALFENEPRYYGAESTAALVFRQWPRNVAFEEVLAKVIVLNRLYGTNIWNEYTVAQHIVSRRIDERLSAGDLQLVEEVAAVTFGERVRNLLSFASKYCSWHMPDHFQIFDNNVEWLLWAYQQQFRFSSFHRYELRSYPRFVQIMDELRQYFGLQQFSRKVLDKFLWIEGGQRWAPLSSSSEVA